MTAYVVGRLWDVTLGCGIKAYLEQMDATLAPFGGRYVVHGGPFERLEGDWQGDLVVIAFADRAAATGWYESAAYRAIKPLRTANSTADVILIDGVGPDHRAMDVLAAAT